MTTRAEAQAEINKLAWDLRHGANATPPGFSQSLVAVPAQDALRSLEVIQAWLDSTEGPSRPWKIGDPDPQPFIWIKVEGGLADFGGDFDRVEVRTVDFDVSEESVDPDEIVSMIDSARAIPDRLAGLPQDDPRWLDRDGIIESLTRDLQRLIDDDDGDYDGACNEYLTKEVRS